MDLTCGDGRLAFLSKPAAATMLHPHRLGQHHIHHLHQLGVTCYGSVVMEQEPTARKSVTLPISMWEALDTFRFSEKIGSQAEAHRRIILMGLRAAGTIKAEDNQK